MNSNNNRLVMILAAAVVVLFIAFVAVVVLNQGNGATNTAGNTGTTGTGTSTTSTATSNPGIGSSTGATFDPATATKVPAKEEPKDYVARYYQDILDKKWDEAFKMQPAASQAGQTVADFQQTQEQMYGMTSFKVASATTSGDTATVIVDQDLGQNGTWNATWTFQKYNGGWVVESRKVGMGAAK